MNLDPKFYNSHSAGVMADRGILRPGEPVDVALQRAASALLAIDRALNDGQEDLPFEKRVYESIENGIFVFGTPILTNSGREEKVTAACTVLPVHVRGGRVALDRFYADSHAALDNAIGTGYDLSEVDDPCSALEELNCALDAINNSLISQNKRPVASMATLRADHPGVISFVRAKREADFSKWRFNISLFVTDELFRQAKLGGFWELRNQDGSTAGFIKARDLVEEIADAAHYCGEPGILFKDRIDVDNPTPQWEYKSTAPCAEVSMAEGEACQFSYINLSPLTFTNAEGVMAFDTEGFGQAVEDMTRLLDASVEQTVNNTGDLNLPLVREKRRIGVGITGFADLLITLGIPYDDPVAPELAHQISELLDFHSKNASVQLAKERQPFPAFGNSRFKDPKWTRRKIAFSSGAIALGAWEKLFRQMDKHGIRHAATTSLPPTGTSSTIANTSKSLEPHFDLISPNGEPYPSVIYALERSQVDTDGMSKEEIILLLDGISSVLPHLRTARQIDPSAHLKVQAAFQIFLDDSLAKTVNLSNTATRKDVYDLLFQAWASGVKGITFFRDGCLAERLSAKQRSIAINDTKS